MSTNVAPMTMIIWSLLIYITQNKEQPKRSRKQENHIIISFKLINQQ
jgi:hypothetical protein